MDELVLTLPGRVCVPLSSSEREELASGTWIAWLDGDIVCSGPVQQVLAPEGKVIVQMMQPEPDPGARYHISFERIQGRLITMQDLEDGQMVSFESDLMGYTRCIGQIQARVPDENVVRVAVLYSSFVIPISLVQIKSVGGKALLLTGPVAVTRPGEPDPVQLGHCCVHQVHLLDLFGIVPYRREWLVVECAESADREWTVPASQWAAFLGGDAY